MTVNRGLWVPITTGDIGTTDLEARLADAGLFESNDGVNPRSGVLGSTATNLVSGTSGLTYNIAPFYAVIHRTAGEGAYRFAVTGSTSVTTTAAPTSNPRIDVIYVKQNDPNKGDGAINTAVAGVVQGSAAASPVAPAIPAGAMEIARATVGANITGTNAASITQTYRHTALRGEPIPVRNLTERAEIVAPRVGQRVARLDLDVSGRVVEVRNSGGWLAEVAHAEFTASQTNAAPPNTEWGMGTFVRDTAGTTGYESDANTDNAWVTVNSTDNLRIRDAGNYDITVAVAFDNTPPTGVTWLNLGVSGLYFPLTAGTTFMVGSANVRLTAGALINPRLAHGSSGSKTYTCRVRITRKG